MKTSKLEEIGSTLSRLATADMQPKDLMKAVRAEHPDASKKDVVQAAFHTIICNSDSDPSKSDRLHEFALTERSSET